MDFLPKLTQNWRTKVLNDEKLVYSSENQGEYISFKNWFVDYIGADCWALVVNDEIIFNFYDQTKPIRDSILEDIIRNTILENPHSLFCKLFRLEHDSYIDVYMFGKKPYIVTIHFSKHSDLFRISAMQSP